MEKSKTATNCAVTSNPKIRPRPREEPEPALPSDDITTRGMRTYISLLARFRRSLSAMRRRDSQRDRSIGDYGEIRHFRLRAEGLYYRFDELSRKFQAFFSSSRERASRYPLLCRP